eukprot:SAG22_NODE_475_length_10003_cov_3.943356_7_plen_224_part_00
MHRCASPRSNANPSLEVPDRWCSSSAASSPRPAATEWRRSELRLGPLPPPGLRPLLRLRPRARACSLPRFRLRLRLGLRLRLWLRLRLRLRSPRLPPRPRWLTSSAVTTSFSIMTPRLYMSNAGVALQREWRGRQATRQYQLSPSNPAARDWHAPVPFMASGLRRSILPGPDSAVEPSLLRRNKQTRTAHRFSKTASRYPSRFHANIHTHRGAAGVTLSFLRT